MVNADLAAAYGRARYAIDCGGAVVERRVGLVDAAADASLARAGCRLRWSVLTPCNPGSHALADADNARRLEALRAELYAPGWRSLPARNSADDGSWHEPGFCILDAPQSEVAALARRWGQLAFVAAELGHAPRLIWTG